MNSFIHKALMLLVILAPLPLGSNREWAWTLCAFITAMIVLLWAVKSLTRPRSVAVSMPFPVFLLFGLVCVWAWLQSLGSMPEEWRHPLWEMARSITGQGIGGVSLSPGDTLVALMRLICYGLVFFLSFQLGRDARRAHATFMWIFVAGFVYAIYALVMYWGDVDMLLWFKGTGYSNDVRGTFVNRNSFATYTGLALLCAIGVFAQRFANRADPAFAMPMGRERRIEQFILQTWKPLTAILLMTAALILTHSRGGFFSTLAGALTLFWLLGRRRRRASVHSRAALGGAVMVAVIAFVLTSEVLLQRIDQMTIDGNARIEVYEMTTDAAADSPLLGFGYGTYADSFRLYRDDSLRVHFDKAHNTYLENIFELGWPAALSLFMGIAWLGFNCLLGALRRGRDWVFPATGAAATILVGVHSFFDFSLQMPAVAITFACILGVGCAQSYSSLSSD